MEDSIWEALFAEAIRQGGGKQGQKIAPVKTPKGKNAPPPPNLNKGRNEGANLELAVEVSYDVSNWKKIGKVNQIAVDEVLTRYANTVENYVAEILGDPSGNGAEGPGPHPHRTDHDFTWEDTGNLRQALDWRIVTQGYRRSLEFFVNPIETESGDVVDVGAILEIGWHPKVPIGRGQGTRWVQKFYRYPWLSPSVARANAEFRRLLRKEAPLTPNVFVFGRKRSASGFGAQRSKFAFKETITADVTRYPQIDRLNSFLQEIPGMFVSRHVVTKEPLY